MTRGSNRRSAGTFFSETRACDEGKSDPDFRAASDDRLVGIAETDLTDRTIADRCLSFPEGAFFNGAVKIIPFAYGDGAAWLYYPSNNHLQVHCRIVQIADE